MRKYVHLFSLFLAITFLVTLLASCASVGKEASPLFSYSNDSMDVLSTTAATTRVYDEFGFEKTAKDISASSDLYTPQDDRKLIRQAKIMLESEDYDASIQAIQDKISSVGAYIESSEISGYSEYHSRYASLTVRIPSDCFDDFMNAKDNFGVVTSSNIWQDDVTLNYIDMEARLQTLQTKRERLLALLEEATQMSDIIELESALSNTTAEIESYTSNLAHYDNQIAYCTVWISLNEVYRATPVSVQPKTLGERIAKRFIQTLHELGEFGEDFIVLVIGASPVLLLIAIIVVLVVFICVKVSRKKKHRLEKIMAERRVQESQPKIGDEQ